MLLSIVITDYLTHSYLDELDESLIDIKVPFEIIHITNNNLNYKFKSTSNYYSYYYPVGTVSGAKNYGLSKVNGDYCMFIDNDDYLTNSYQINELIKDIYFCKYKDGRCRRQFNGMIVKTSLFEKYNLSFLPVSFYEDFIMVDVLYKLAVKGKITYNIIDEPLYFYRHNPNGICSKLGNKERIIELEKIKPYLKSMELVDLLQDEINKYKE